MKRLLVILGTVMVLTVPAFGQTAKRPPTSVLRTGPMPTGQTVIVRSRDEARPVHTHHDEGSAAFYGTYSGAVPYPYGYGAGYSYYGYQGPTPTFTIHETPANPGHPFDVGQPFRR